MSFIKKPRPRLFMLLSVLCCVLLFSCFARIDGALEDGGASDLRLRVSVGPKSAALLRSLRSFMGGSGDAPILDGPALSRSLAEAPGIASASLRNSGPEALDGTISLSHIGDFLSPAAAENRFISFREEGGISSLVLTLDKKTAPDIIPRLSAEAAEYLSALMAPALIGEEMTKQEYLDLVSSVYGKDLADEIAAASVEGRVDFPRPVKTALGGTFSGKRAIFDIPLLDILVLESPLRYEITW